MKTIALSVLFLLSSASAFAETELYRGLFGKITKMSSCGGERIVEVETIRLEDKDHYHVEAVMPATLIISDELLQKEQVKTGHHIAVHFEELVPGFNGIAVKVNELVNHGKIGRRR